MPAAPAGRQAGAGDASGSQGGSLEDVSLKSLAPGAKGLDSAALRAHLNGSARRGGSRSGAAMPFWEDEQGEEYHSATPCVPARTVAVQV